MLIPLLCNMKINLYKKSSPSLGLLFKVFNITID